MGQIFKDLCGYSQTKHQMFKTTLFTFSLKDYVWRSVCKSRILNSTFPLLTFTRHIFGLCVDECLGHRLFSTRFIKECNVTLYLIIKGIWIFNNTLVYNCFKQLVRGHKNQIFSYLVILSFSSQKIILLNRGMDFRYMVPFKTITTIHPHRIVQ